MHKRFLVFLLVLSALVLTGISISIISAAPSGAILTPLSNSSAPEILPSNISAYAGNITNVNIQGTSTTQAWQGYYGNVSGTIQLADANKNVMYNWSALSPSGRVYSSVNGSIVWTNIQCFNFTATGALGDESGTRGGTSLTGINLTSLEEEYNITNGDPDGVNATFNRNDHSEFFSNSMKFIAGQCPNTKIFNSTGQGSYDEALMWAPDSGSVVFTSLIQSKGDGFNGKSQDFEMLVLENGHNGNTALTSYYFYVELQ